MGIKAALIATLFTLLSLPAHAEDKQLERAKEVGERYNECVYFSAIEHLSETNNDISAAAEKAFASCKTEYDQMVSIMQTWGLMPEQIEAALLDKKAGIKRELRNMVLETKGIVKPKQ